MSEFDFKLSKFAIVVLAVMLACFLAIPITCILTGHVAAAEEILGGAGGLVVVIVFLFLM